MSLLEISILPGKGRGYKATRDIPAGTVVHVSNPLATTVSQEWTPETCLWCFDFVYPKKQKIKAVSEQEQLKLSIEWNVPNNKKKIGKYMSFCSELCKSNCQNSLQSEWVPMLAIHYRLDTEFNKEKSIITNTPPPPSSSSSSVIIAVDDDTTKKWFDIDQVDDNVLTTWLNNAWTCLTENLEELEREIDDTDRSMCRLISACILRKQYSPSDFNKLYEIQNNELSHFKTHLKSKQLPTQPITKSDYLSLIPTEVLDIMALYSFFARAVMKPLQKVPTVIEIDHDLFRSIYFRERANSFGLWEMSSNEMMDENGVSDDLELLGFGLYPSAVYFNHSCDANVVKIRDGREIKFVTKRMLEEGEEACISYGSVHEDVYERRERLLEHYHFICQCTRCIQEDMVIR